MFFAKPGEYSACEIYSFGHFILLTITIILISIVFNITKTKDKVKIKKIIKNCTIIIWVLEIVKIILTIYIGNGKNPNTYLPCYYCSLFLYASILSSIGKGKLKKVGDVFLETGSIIAGIIFLIFPTTSLPEYPAIHFLSIHSFFFHGMMIYIGKIMNFGKYAILYKEDIKYYFILVVGISIIAYILNFVLNTNFMFITQDLPNTLLTTVYKITGKMYTFFMVLIQAIVPFYIIFYLQKLFNNKKVIIHYLKGLR